MSTTFGIIAPSLYCKGETEEVEVARQVSSTVIWKDPLAQLLPDDTPVEALDNSAQGIYTIGDIRRAVNKQKERY